VQPGGNAAKAGLKSGDTVLYTSSWFGDELWPADKLAFTKTAINAKSNEVDFVVLRGKAGDEVNVKRLKARPSPPRFGRKLTEGSPAACLAHPEVQEAYFGRKRASSSESESHAVRSRPHG